MPGLLQHVSSFSLTIDIGLFGYVLTVFLYFAYCYVGHVHLVF